MLMRRPPTRRQAGFTMIEVLVSLLVFSLGVLALVSIQGTAARMATDARDRATATFLADQLLARMLIADPATAASFAHRATGTTACAPSGASSGNAIVTGWLTEVERQLPGASADVQQIVVQAGTGQVTVRLCWQNGNDPARSLSVTNQVQWQP
ncbi:MAG: type IV pilus modification protein PilV [Leptothrix sp. (in: Bacteria)]|nr:type IV pilus modification protein PilV [Leptothrix sp. (in: b-proteobacteria)]